MLFTSKTTTYLEQVLLNPFLKNHITMYFSHFLLKYTLIIPESYEFCSQKEKCLGQFLAESR